MEELVKRVELGEGVKVTAWRSLGLRFDHGGKFWAKEYVSLLMCRLGSIEYLGEFMVFHVRGSEEEFIIGEDDKAVYLTRV